MRFFTLHKIFQKTNFWSFSINLKTSQLFGGVYLFISNVLLNRTIRGLDFSAKIRIFQMTYNLFFLIILLGVHCRLSKSIDAAMCTVFPHSCIVLLLLHSLILIILEQYAPLYIHYILFYTTILLFLRLVLNLISALVSIVQPSLFCTDFHYSY